MGYVYFTEEQKERANTVDLKDFLERQGERLLRSGPEWRMSSDHSITIGGTDGTTTAPLAKAERPLIS